MKLSGSGVRAVVIKFKRVNLCPSRRQGLPKKFRNSVCITVRSQPPRGQVGAEKSDTVKIHMNIEDIHYKRSTEIIGSALAAFRSGGPNIPLGKHKFPTSIENFRGEVAGGLK